MDHHNFTEIFMLMALHQESLPEQLLECLSSSLVLLMWDYHGGTTGRLMLNNKGLVACTA
jgi:hypothetical protein